MKIKSLKQASRAAFTPLVSAGVCICITTVHAADWDGSTSTDWNTGSNWSGDVVPSGVDANINTGTSNVPVISADAGTVSGVSIGSGWGGTGRLDQTAGSLAVQNGGWPYGWVLVGGDGYSNGTYNIANTAATGGTYTGYGTGSGSLTAGGDLRVGAGQWWSNATGLMNINTSGTVQIGGWLHVGGNNGGTGTVNIDAGTVSANTAWIGSGSATSAATGTLKISGGTLTLANRLVIGLGNSTSGGVNVGVVTLSGGTLTTDATHNNSWDAGVNMASGYDTATGGSATFNLDGGTLSTLNVFSEGTKGTSIFNFNGGTLQGQANRDSLNGGQFMGNQSGYWQPVNDITRANVRNGGAVIDTNGFNLYVGQQLEHSNIGGDAAIDGGLTKNGAGQLEIAGANSFTGQVVVNSGTLYASTFDWNGGAAFGSASGITVNNGATLKANSNSLFGTWGSHAGPITVNAGGSAITQGGRQDVGLLTLNGGTLASSGSIGAGGSWMFGRFSDKKLLVTADSTVSAEKVVFRNNATIEVDSGRKLDFTGTISDNSDGASAVIKTGSGSLVLAGSNTYTGSTTVNAGTLAINGNQIAATGSVGVNNTGTRLIGTGTVGGNTTVNSGAIHSAGGAVANVNKVGLQTFDQTDASTTNLTYGNGSIFEWDLNANKDTDGADNNFANTTDNGTRGTDFDAVNVSGTLAVDSGTIFRVVLGSSVTADNFWLQTQTWTDIFGGGFTLSGTGFNNSLLEVVDASGNTYDQSTLNPGYGFTVSGTTLTWSAVPEPSSALAGLLIAAGLMRRRRY
jgi:autotransporter-associated beta strand protein